MHRVVGKPRWWNLCDCEELGRPGNWGANQRLKGGDAESLEAETILLRVNLAIEKGWSQVEIKSVSEVIINQLRERDNRWRIETIYSNISRLASNTASIEWKIIQQTTNESAN